MICEQRVAPAVLAELRMATAAVRVLYPPRIVQSVYLDTHEGRAVAENLAGVSERSKIRFRWYGDASHGVRGRLERKRRRGGLGMKDVLELPAPVNVAGVGRQAFARRLLSLCPPAWRQALSSALEPAQWIRYRRQYYRTADGAVRITLDQELRAFDLRNTVVLSADRPTPLSPVLIVELKAAASARDRVEALLQELPLVVDKCSKFVLASAPGSGPTVSIPPW